MKPESYYVTYRRLLENKCYFPNIDIKEYEDYNNGIFKATKKRVELSTLVRMKHEGKWYARLHFSSITLNLKDEEEQKMQFLLGFLQSIHKSTHIGKVIPEIDMLDDCQISEEERLRNIEINYQPMTITTKFIVGEDGYILLDRKVHKMKVISININILEFKTEERYELESEDGKLSGIFNAEELFKTRQDLLDTL